jgi:hypothetical protein
VVALDGTSGRGLGWVSLKWFARQASRFSYHGTRTVGIGFRHRGKGPSQVLISAAGAHTEAPTLLRRHGQGGAAADGAELQEVV